MVEVVEVVKLLLQFQPAARGRFPFCVYGMARHYHRYVGYVGYVAGDCDAVPDDTYIPSVPGASLRARQLGRVDLVYEYMQCVGGYFLLYWIIIGFA